MDEPTRTDAETPPPAGDAPGLDVTPEGLAAEIEALTLEATPEPPEGENLEHAPQLDPVTEYTELLNPVLFAGFSILAPAWGVTEGEAQQLSAAYAPLLAKYFPEGPGDYGPEIGAALVTVSIIAPRLGKPRKDTPKTPERQEEGDPEPTPQQTRKGEAQVTGALPE